jgi:hypothetical protein
MTQDKKIKKVRELINDNDLSEAVAVLRAGLKATTRSRSKAPAEKGRKAGYEYKEVADNSVRLNCAKMLLEYGFGKPHTSQTIEVKGDRRPMLTTADIAARIAASGADLQRIAGAYVDGLAEAEPAIEELPDEL